MNEYKVPKEKNLVLKSKKNIPVEKTKHYEWKYNYKLKKSKDVSVYAVIILTDENRNRVTGRRIGLLKNNGGEMTEGIIRFSLPLDTTHAQCAYHINRVEDPADKSDVEVMLEPIDDIEVSETNKLDEIYDDIFNYDKKYSAVDLEKEPWLAIGGKHNHVGKVKNFKDRLPYLKNKCGLTPDSSVLDVGCGTGGFANLMREFSNSPDNYVGIDLVQDAIDYCNKHYPEFTFYKGEMDSVPKLDRKFDFICLFNVIIHMYPEDIVKLITDLRQYLKEDGSFILTATINNSIKDFNGTMGSNNMTFEYFKDLMKKSGLENIIEIHQDPKDGQRPFIVKV